MQELNLSQVNVPISLKIQEIEATINNQIDGVLYENVDLSDSSNTDLRIKAEKTENITISFDSNHIKYRVPLKVWVKKIIPVTLVEVEVEGTIALSFSTEFKIENDWKLSTHTEIMEYEWLQKPHLRLGIFDIPIKFVANTILKKSKTLLCTKLDEELAKNFSLQNYAKEAWKTLRSPVLVSEEFSVWLIISPVKVGMTPLFSDGEIIKSTIMVDTYVDALIGEKPKIEKEVPLPSFQFSENVEEDFHLYLSTEVTYSDAEKMAKKYAIGEIFSSGRRSVTIEDLKLSGKAEKIKIETELLGSYNGAIALIGKPVFHAEKNEIEIKNFEYELNTRNLLIRFINWLFHWIIKKMIKRHLSFQLTEPMNELMIKMGKKLENYEIADNVFLTGNLLNLNVENIQTGEKGLNITITANGKLNLFINKIEFEEAFEKE